MTTDVNRELARRAKAYVRPTDTFDSSVPRSLWFHRPRNGIYRHVPIKSITTHSDEEYIEWRTVDPKITHTFNLERKLDRWLRDIDEEELAALFAKTPTGLAADPDTGVSIDFTLWQRLSMIFYVTLPVTVTSSVKIDTEALRDLAGYGPHETHVRKIPIVVDRTLLGGTMPDFGIVDLPTAAGKTAWSCVVGFLAVSSMWRRLLLDYQEKQRGVIFQGKGAVSVARLVLLSTGGSTFQHFVKTLTRLIPKFRELSPGTEFVLWTKMSKYYSVEEAHKMHNTIVFWVVPVKELTGILREHSHIAVAVNVTDEFTVDTPKSRASTATSPVLKQLILQATPQALTKATHGSRSLLKDFFGGTLYAPSNVADLMKHREFKEAELACRQLALLDLTTLLHPFRDRVRQDLEFLTPAGLDVYHAKSARCTFTSHLLRSQSDMVPASLANILVASLRYMHPEAQSIATFREQVESRVMTPSELVEAIEAVRHTSTNVAAKERLVARIREFEHTCPICMEDNPSSGFRIFGCCGYCVCTACYEIDHDRCAFCRKQVAQFVTREEAMLPTLEEEVLPEYYPDPPRTFVNDSLHDNLLAFAKPANKQVANLTVALQCLAHAGMRRTLLIVECRTFTTDLLFKYANPTLLGVKSGYEVVPIDGALNGKGTKFAQILKRFDSPDPQPIALMSFSRDDESTERFLIGTDLAFADSIVTVGGIHESMMTQALGRIFRPRASRDNTKPMVMVKIGI